MNKNKIIQELDLQAFGAKGWMSSSACLCPNCNSYDKFGILFLEKGGVAHCFKDDYSTSLNKYLKTIGRSDLIDYEKSISLRGSLSPLVDEKEEVSLKVGKVNLPLGFKRIYYDDYLEDRGFEPWQYNYFNVGVSTERRLKDCLVFLIKDKDNNTIAWLSRSKLSKSWHEQNLKDYKAGKASLKLRYNNSENTDFSKILLGENELDENTESVILTEGVFDKANVDRCFNLRENKQLKCCATFGNSLTTEQAQILINHGIENLFFGWDFGTVSSTQHSTMKIANQFRSIKVMQFKDKLIDAGDAEKYYLLDLFKNSVDYFHFYKGRIGELKLKNI